MDQEDKEEFLVRRAEEEEARADACPEGPARDRHADLAAQYRARLAGNGESWLDR